MRQFDVEDFHFAGRVDFMVWAEGSGRYLSFVKGKGPVAQYFCEFLGYDATMEGRLKTRNLVEALMPSADCRDFGPEERRKSLDRALDACDRDARAQKVLDFAALSNELHPEKPTALLDILADPDRVRNEHFVAHRRAPKRLANLERETSSWSVEFERKALHAGKVRFNPETNSITLFEVPDDLHISLLEEAPGG